MKLVNSNPHPKTILAEDGDTIYLHPGVHHNINSKFGWNLPHRVRKFENDPRQVVSTHASAPKEVKSAPPVSAMDTALSSAKAARVPDTKAK